MNEHISKAAVGALVAVVLGIGLVSVYANWQHAHRNEIESAKVTRFAPTPSPSRSPAP